MKGTIHTTTIQGHEFKYWADFIMRAEYAEDENGEVKMIRGSGYIHNDLTVRKAIASAYNLGTFRK